MVLITYSLTNKTDGRHAFMLDGIMFKLSENFEKKPQNIDDENIHAGTLCINLNTIFVVIPSFPINHYSIPGPWPIQ